MATDVPELLQVVLDAVDDLRSLQAEARKRHEALWGAEDEALRGIERLVGRISGQLRNGTPAGSGGRR